MKNETEKSLCLEIAINNINPILLSKVRRAKKATKDSLIIKEALAMAIDSFKNRNSDYWKNSRVELFYTPKKGVTRVVVVKKKWIDDMNAIAYGRGRIVNFGLDIMITKGDLK